MSSGDGDSFITSKSIMKKSSIKSDVCFIEIY